MKKILASAKATPETMFLLYTCPVWYETSVSLLKVTSANGNQAGIRFSIFIPKNTIAPWDTNRFHVQNMTEQEEPLDFTWVMLSEWDQIYAFVTGSNTEITFMIFWEEELYNRDERYGMINTNLDNIKIAIDDYTAQSILNTADLVVAIWNIP